MAKPLLASLSLLEPILTSPDSSWIQCLLLENSMTWLFRPFSRPLPTAFPPCFCLSLPCRHNTVKRTERVTLVRVLQLRIIHRVWKLVEDSWLTRVHRLEFRKKRILISDKTIVQRIVRAIWKRIKSNCVVFMLIHSLTVVPRSKWMRSLRRWRTARVLTVAVGWMWRAWIWGMNWEVIFRIHSLFWNCLRKWVSDKDFVDFVNYYKADREIIFNAPKEIQMWGPIISLYKNKWVVKSILSHT